MASFAFFASFFPSLYVLAPFSPTLKPRPSLRTDGEARRPARDGTRSGGPAPRLRAPLYKSELQRRRASLLPTFSRNHEVLGEFKCFKEKEANIVPQGVVKLFQEWANLHKRFDH